MSKLPSWNWLPRRAFLILITWSSVSLVLAFNNAMPAWGQSSKARIFSSKLESTNPLRSNGEFGNMFQSDIYSKPIVLLGSSGTGDELSRLAEYFLWSVSGGGQTDGTVGSNAVIVPVSGVDSQGAPVVHIDSLMHDIEAGRFKYPDVIVLDFNHKHLETGQGDKLTEYYADLAKALYDSGMLSIYVNVHPEHSKMTQMGANGKAELEESVFVKFSDYELCIRDEGVLDPEDGWSHIEWELHRLVARAMLLPPIPGDTTRSMNTAHLTMGAHTFFLSLSFPEITDAEPFVQDMCGDVDAMEYRTDLLACRDSRFDLIYGQQLLRKYCRPFSIRGPGLPFGGQVLDDVMPIVYTVRTQNQAGTYPDDATGIERMFELLKWGLRSGVEVLDVETAWDPAKTDELIALAQQRYSSQILGSHHVVGQEVTIERAVRLFQQCALDGRAHGAKVVLSIKDGERDRMAYDAAIIAASLAASEGKPVIPNISLILGDVGTFSRVLNIPFTPVTHESLPFKAAPGQLTSNEIMTTRLLTKIMYGKRYAILGHNIAYSVSPQMHGAAFAATRLPHQYYRADVESVEKFVTSDFFKASDFGGCSVTIPHKQSIIPYVDVMSEAAKAIGSVNTLVVKEEIGSDEFERIIYGDNTDWRGIYNPLRRKLGQVKSQDYALILGAGGTARAAAYAAEKLGLQRLYYNRTPEKAIELAEAFGGTVLTGLGQESSADGLGLGNVLSDSSATVRVVISTLPAASNFELPDWMISSDSSASRPIVFDVNYKPYYTKLLIQAENAGCPVIRGSEMLWEQGVGQFELWTERCAPYRVMKDVVLENCLPKEETETSEQMTESEVIAQDR